MNSLEIREERAPSFFFGAKCLIRGIPPLFFFDKRQDLRYYLTVARNEKLILIANSKCSLLRLRLPRSYAFYGGTTF